MNKAFLLCTVLALILSCSDEAEESRTVRFERIQYHHVRGDVSDSLPFQQRLTYFYDSGQPYRYLVVDSSSNISTDYLYFYDASGVNTHALYREEIDTTYELERFSYNSTERTKTTEWVSPDSVVYYTMVEYLDSLSRPYRASFEGDKLHGYDSIFYNERGFEERIFFTNLKGQRLNERSFNYTLIDENGWASRQLIRSDSIQQIQYRTLSYDLSFSDSDLPYYPGIVSLFDGDENAFSLSKDGSSYFLTRSIDWTHQIAYYGQKQDGLLQEGAVIEVLDTIYNGAISPSGDRIIYCKRSDEGLAIWLTQMVDNTWQSPIDLTAESGVKGGYFQWHSEDDLYFYIEDNLGDLVYASLSNDLLEITEHLDVFNTEEATEFSPWMDPWYRFFIFTRYEEDLTSNQGFFISYNQGNSSTPSWTVPEKIDQLPYGWGTFIDYEESVFLYTDGNDIQAQKFEWKDGRLTWL